MGPEANHAVCPHSQHVYKDSQIHVNVKGRFELKGNMSPKEKSKGCGGGARKGDSCATSGWQCEEL